MQSFKNNYCISAKRSKNNFCLPESGLKVEQKHFDCHQKCWGQAAMNDFFLYFTDNQNVMFKFERSREPTTSLRSLYRSSEVLDAKTYKK